MIMTLDITAWETRSAFTVSRGSQNIVETVEAGLHHQGAVGRGEGVGVGYAGETAASLCQQLLSLRETIEAGVDRDAIQQLLPPGGARNALDCAFWDLEAKISRRSAWELAGLDDPGVIPLTATLSLDQPHVMAAAATKAPKHTALKVKLGGADYDLDRVIAIRRACPQSVLLCDVNEAWSFDDLRRLTPDMKKLGVQLIEQPLKAEEDSDLDGYVSPVPLCADESCTDCKSLPELVGRYDFINIKLEKTGGLTEALALAKAARAHRMRVFVGCMLCTSLGIGPARLLSAWGEWFDIDGPTYLKQDRQPHLTFYEGVLLAPPAGFWGTPQ